MNRRTFIQGIVALAALGPLGRLVVPEERLLDQMRPATFEPLPMPPTFQGVPLYWEPNLERARHVPTQLGPTKMRALVLFGEWAQP